MKKKPQPNITQPNQSKKDSRTSKYFTAYSIREMREFLINDDYAEKLAKELMDWAEAENKSNLRMNKFYRKIKLSRSEFDKLALHFPVLAKAREYAVEAIGDYRERLAIFSKRNPNALIFAMPLYCPDWVEVGELRAKWNKEPEKKDQQITVVLERNETGNKDKVKPV